MHLSFFRWAHLAIALAAASAALAAPATDIVFHDDFSQLNVEMLSAGVIGAEAEYHHVPKYGRDYFEATGKKTTNLACTNATKVGEFPIPLPSLPEQEAICTYLDEKLGDQERLVTGIETQIATLAAYRKSLIHECVTGQRRVGG